MAGGNLSPRQKMIGMMYLVLTALLALNVSKSILDAFVLVNDGLETTTRNFGKKNEITYHAFEFAKKNNPVKVEKYYKKAFAIKDYSQKMVKYIEELKSLLVEKSDKIEKKQADTLHLAFFNAKDDTNTPNEILIGSSEDGRNGKAHELKVKVDEFKKNVMTQLKDVTGGDKINLGLDTKDPKASAEAGKESWETHNFEHLPMAAVITLLTKLQSDVKNAEADAINHLLTQIDAGDFKFDTLVAKVIPISSYIVMGNEYSADVFVAAYSSTQDPEVIVNGSPIPVEGGMGKYKVRPTKEGENKWGGTIKVKAPDGTIKEYPFESKYVAARPSTVISATKMNVLYIGVDNPISISAPGISNDKIKATISAGTLRPDKDPGTFLATVKGGGKVTINVQAEIDGKVQQMGSQEYRVKMVPDPIAKLANTVGGPINRSVLAAQAGIIPVLENFDFQMNFVINSFSMTRSGKGIDPMTFTSNSNQLSEDMKKAIKNSRAGDKIYFELIKAKGPDGVPRNLSPVIFTIQ